MLMNELSLLKQWRSVEPGAAVSMAARRVFGVYATLPGAAWYRLVLHRDHTYHLERARDKGAHWVELLRGSYRLPGYELQLAMPATQRGRDYAWCARLQCKKDGAGSIQELVPAVQPAEAAPISFCRREYPQLLRCIDHKSGLQTFTSSLVVGNAYVALGPAKKAGYVEVLNEQQRVRQYPTDIFRRCE